MHATQTSSIEYQRPDEAQLPTNKYRSATHWYLSFFWRSPGLVILSLGVSLISTLLTLAPSLLLGMAFVTLKNDGFSTGFVLICLSIIGTALLNFVFTFITNYAW